MIPLTLAPAYRTGRLSLRGRGTINKPSIEGLGRVRKSRVYKQTLNNIKSFAELHEKTGKGEKNGQSDFKNRNA